MALHSAAALSSQSGSSHAIPPLNMGHDVAMNVFKTYQSFRVMGRRIRGCCAATWQVRNRFGLSNPFRARAFDLPTQFLVGHTSLMTNSIVCGLSGICSAWLFGSLLRRFSSYAACGVGVDPSRDSLCEPGATAADAEDGDLTARVYACPPASCFLLGLECFGHEFSGKGIQVRGRQYTDNGPEGVFALGSFLGGVVFCT